LGIKACLVDVLAFAGKGNLLNTKNKRDLGMFFLKKDIRVEKNKVFCRGRIGVFRV